MSIEAKQTLVSGLTAEISSLLFVILELESAYRTFIFIRNPDEDDLEYDLHFWIGKYSTQVCTGPWLADNVT